MRDQKQIANKNYFEVGHSADQKTFSPLSPQEDKSDYGGHCLILVVSDLVL